MQESLWRDEHSQIYVHAKGEQFVRALTCFGADVGLSPISDKLPAGALPAPYQGISISFSRGQSGFFLTNVFSDSPPSEFTFEAYVSANSSIYDVCVGLIGGILSTGLICIDLVDLLIHFRGSRQAYISTYQLDQMPPALPRSARRYCCVIWPKTNNELVTLTQPTFMKIIKPLETTSDEQLLAKFFIQKTSTPRKPYVLLLHS